MGVQIDVLFPSVPVDFDQFVTQELGLSKEQLGDKTYYRADDVEIQSPAPIVDQEWLADVRSRIPELPEMIAASASVGGVRQEEVAFKIKERYNGTVLYSGELGKELR